MCHDGLLKEAKSDDFVKNPSAALRCNDEVEARLASGPFAKPASM
jgi:hypothetical protein